MKTLLLIFTLSLGYACFAQKDMQPELEIQYEMLLNLKNLKTYKSKLFYTNKESYFHWNDTNEKTEAKESSNDFGNYEFDIVITDSIGTVNHIDFAQDSIHTRSLHFKDPTLLSEKITKIEWELKEDTKVIGSLTCNKAVGKFRGRTYTVWYSSSIPLPLGPWKLHGLSGIIVEAYDDTKTVQFYMTSIKNQGITNDHDYDYIFSEGKPLTIQEYAKIQSELGNELIRKIKSKVPRGVHITVDSSSENFLEKDFESIKK